MTIDDLRRGDLVVAAEDLDPDGAAVRRGTLGVVFEEAGAYGDGGGPMVRWFTGGACEVDDDEFSLPEDFDFDEDATELS